MENGPHTGFVMPGESEEDTGGVMRGSLATGIRNDQRGWQNKDNVVKISAIGHNSSKGFVDTSSTGYGRNKGRRRDAEELSQRGEGKGRSTALVRGQKPSLLTSLLILRSRQRCDKRREKDKRGGFQVKRKLG